MESLVAYIKAGPQLIGKLLDQRRGVQIRYVWIRFKDRIQLFDDCCRVFRV